MQSINLITRTGSSFSLNLSQNNVIRSGHTHTLTLEIKFTGKGYIIQNCELKEKRPRGRVSRFLTDATQKFNSNENAPPGTESNDNESDEENFAASFKRRLSQPLVPNPFNSNESLHALAIAPPIKRMREFEIETDKITSRTV